MSRAAVKQKLKAKKLERQFEKIERIYAKMEADAKTDAVEAACDNCGLEQVSPGPSCILCGCETGTFVRFLPGHANG